MIYPELESGFVEDHELPSSLLVEVDQPLEEPQFEDSSTVLELIESLVINLPAIECDFCGTLSLTNEDLGLFSLETLWSRRTTLEEGLFTKGKFIEDLTDSRKV